MKQGYLLWTGMFILWVVGGLIILYSPPSAPIELLGGDFVSPKRVKPGDAFTVTRNFRVTRNDFAQITRTMVKGDCRSACEIIDLPGGNLALERGLYMSRSRVHSVPLQANAGTWRLVFSYTYEDQLGRKIRRNLPELSIEVVQ